VLVYVAAVVVATVFCEASKSRFSPQPMHAVTCGDQVAASSFFVGCCCSWQHLAGESHPHNLPMVVVNVGRRRNWNQTKEGPLPYRAVGDRGGYVCHVSWGVVGKCHGSERETHHNGHVPEILINHGSIQWGWNLWSQGKTRTSSPTVKSSVQMEQPRCSSFGP